MPRGDGPFQVLDRINNSAYKLDLSNEYNVSVSFNVADLSPFDVGDHLRTISFQEEGNDVDKKATLRDPLQIPIGPKTTAKAKSFKEALHRLIMTIQYDPKKTQLNMSPKEDHGLVNLIQATK